MDDPAYPRIRTHPARGRAPVSYPRPPDPSRRGTLLFNGVVAVIGAVAAATTTVLALRPRDVTDAAEFRSVSVSSGVSYLEYRQRSEPPHPVPQSLDHGWGAAAGPGTEALRRGPEVGAAGLPRRSGHGSGAAALRRAPGLGPRPGALSIAASTRPRPEPAVPATSTGGRSPSASAPSAVPRMLNRPPPGAGDSLRLAPVSPALPSAVPIVTSFCPPRRFTGCEAIAKDLSGLYYTNAEGEPLSTKQAGAEVAAVIKGSRTTSAGKGRKQLVGAVVDVNVELSGLKGETVRLSWSLWRAKGNAQVYRTWLNDNLAYELTPGTDHDTAGLNFWIPLPKAKGPYFVKAKLTPAGGGAPLAVTTSSPFT